MYRAKNPNFKDPFQYKFGFEDMDGWSVLHLFQYLLFGFLFPKLFYPAMIIGILWEISEFYCEYYRTEWLKKYNFTTDNDDIWWYGKVSDILFNIIGFRIGMYLRGAL